MNIFSLILGIITIVIFLFSAHGYYRSRPASWHISLGLAFLTATILVQLLTTTHPIHF